jgi:hypothetical protein
MRVCFRARRVHPRCHHAASKLLLAESPLGAPTGYHRRRVSSSSIPSYGATGVRFIAKGKDFYFASWRQVYILDWRDAVRTCPLCEGDLCGMAIDVDGDRVLAIRGDDDDPFSRGYLCPKAVGAAVTCTTTPTGCAADGARRRRHAADRPVDEAFDDRGAPAA